MKEYLYLWIDQFYTLNDYDLPGKNSLIEKQGFSLSSKYNVDFKEKNKKELIFTIRKNEYIPDSFFSKKLSDIKALVGRNGSGKTLCLKHLLYRIIAKEFDVDEIIPFVLIYCIEGKLYYHKSKALKKTYKIKFNECEITPDLSVQASKSGKSFFYTAAFDNTERLDVFHGTHNLSTNALLSSDDQTLNNISLKYRRKINRNYSHITMEIIRKILFIARFYEDIAQKNFLKFRMPNAVVIAPSYIDIENAIAEITNNNKRLINDWEITKQGIKNFADWFRFAALLNHIRADLTNSFVKKATLRSLKKDLSPRNIANNGIKKTLELYSTMPIVRGGKKIRIQKRVDFYTDVESALQQLKKLSSFQKEVRKKHPNYNKDSFFFDINEKTHRDVLKKFMDSYIQLAVLTPFLFMNWRSQSSGERIFIEFFSRFYYDLLIQEIRDNQNQTEEYIKEKKHDDIYLIIDEADLYLHPEWQRHWLSEFIEMTNAIIDNIYTYNKPQIQIIISTHSPFIITDFPKENLVLLDPDPKTNKLNILKKHYVTPFGANIYDLLSDGFFLQNSIGFFSEQQIQEVVRYTQKLKKKREEESEDFLKKIEYIKKSIGDPIIQNLINNEEAFK